MKHIITMDAMFRFGKTDGYYMLELNGEEFREFSKLSPAYKTMYIKKEGDYDYAENIEKIELDEDSINITTIK